MENWKNKKDPNDVLLRQIHEGKRTIDSKWTARGPTHPRPDESPGLHDLSDLSEFNLSNTVTDKC